MNVSVPISVGELVDKITILEIKSERIKCPDKLKNVKTELDILDMLCKDIDIADNMHKCLKEINSTIWDIEDKVRSHERSSIFGTDFITTARMVYKFNDERARIKYEINKMYGSKIVEEKSYTQY